MRLIDADKLYLPPEDIGSRMAVACAPTAYDVEKVVEELISISGKLTAESWVKLKSIIERGGIDEG